MEAEQAYLFPVIKKWGAGALQDPAQFHPYKLILTSISSFFNNFYSFLQRRLSKLYKLPASGHPRGQAMHYTPVNRGRPGRCLEKLPPVYFWTQLPLRPSHTIPVSSSPLWSGTPPSGSLPVRPDANTVLCTLLPLFATGRIHLCKLTLWDLAEVQTRKPVRVYYVTTN